VGNILSEQDALELDQEEVHELREVLKHGLVGLLGDGVVATGTERAGDTLLENGMSDNLNRGGHCETESVTCSRNYLSRDQLTSQRHVQKLEGPAEERQVAGGEDKADNASVGNGGRTGLLPLYIGGVSKSESQNPTVSRQRTLSRLYSKEW